ncbi:prepilin [Rubrivivax gelatinosus]|nr:prepilin [Rubrivivax gelatinosus]
MRQLKLRGLTLIELMVALAIGAMLMFAAAPQFGEFVSNSRLREAGNLLYTQALLAQSEALKRNNTVRLDVDGATVKIIDMGPDDPVTLRQVDLAGGATASDAATIDFNARGMLADDASVDLSLSGQTCGGELRCPGLRVDGGGAIRLCSDQKAC